jgi:septal ring factor EnvC (AmiA/AmiB activator)
MSLPFHAVPDCLSQQALTAKQQQLSAEASSLEQQLSAAASMRLELVQLRADMLERLGTFFGELRQQRQAEMEAINNTAAEVSQCVCVACK